MPHRAAGSLGVDLDFHESRCPACGRHHGSGSESRRPARTTPRDRPAAPARSAAVDIPLLVERQGRVVLGVALAVGIGGVFRLALGRVVEQQVEQVDRGGRGMDPARESLPDQPRQPARVVDVGVGEHDGVDRCRRHAERLPVSLPQPLLTLKEAAVERAPGCRRPRADAANPRPRRPLRERSVVTIVSLIRPALRGSPAACSRRCGDRPARGGSRRRRPVRRLPIRSDSSQWLMPPAWWVEGMYTTSRRGRRGGGFP